MIAVIFKRGWLADEAASHTALHTIVAKLLEADAPKQAVGMNLVLAVVTEFSSSQVSAAAGTESCCFDHIPSIRRAIWAWRSSITSNATAAWRPSLCCRCFRSVRTFEPCQRLGS